jgi:hypothetical protein
MVEKIKKIIGYQQPVVRCDKSIMCVCDRCVDEVLDMKYIKRLSRKGKK